MMKKTILFALLCGAALTATTISCTDGGKDEPDPTTWSVTFTGAQNGTATATPDKAVAGTEITVTATPSTEAFAFAGWTVVSGGITVPNTATATFTMPDNNVVLTPLFSANVYSITIATTEHGEVATDPQDEAVAGVEVALTATPDPGYFFAGWTVTCDETAVAVTPDAADDNKATFIMPAGDVEVEAAFTANPTYTVTFGAMTGGTASANPAGPVEAGTNVTVTAVPTEGEYTFGSWSVTSGTLNISDPSAASFSFEMPAGNIELTPTFTPVPKYTVTFGAMTGGTASVNPTGAQKAGTEITVTATPTEGEYTFGGWSVTGGTLDITTPNANPLIFAMPAGNVELTSIFTAIPTYTVTLGAMTGGSVAVSPTGRIKAGVEVTLTATPTGEYTFKSWTVTGGGITLAATSTVKFNMPAADVEVKAEFELPVATPGNAPYILYLATDGKLSAGAYGDFTMANMLYFKFGSVVGMGGLTMADTWSTSAIKFNPSDAAPADYASIPCAVYPISLASKGTSSTNATCYGTVGYYASDEWHTGAHVKAGAGDPCRLVGKTAAEIKAMSETEIAAYDSGLRIMSQAEALRLAGEYTTGNTRGDHMFTPPAVPVQGAVLPHTGDEPYDVSKFFPAGGYLDATSGALKNAWQSGDEAKHTLVYGRYWLDTGASTNANQAYYLTFGRYSDASVNINSTVLAPRTGQLVRCMPKQ